MRCTESIEKVIYSSNIRFRRKSNYFYGCSFCCERRWATWSNFI